MDKVNYVFAPGPESGGRTVFVVEERPNPSTDYFVLPALSVSGHRVIRRGFGDPPSPDDLAGAMVVFVRYVSSSWVNAVESARGRLHRLVFFIDDDVLDLTASAGMPWRYRFKLARLAAWKARWLRRQEAELWVATPYLMQKYASWRPRLVAPSFAQQEAGLCRVFYHGSASHRAEIRWLYPIIREVMQRDERIVFEIIGGHDVYRLYRKLPRVTVVHTMRWPAYQAFLSLQERHVGLAPLLSSPFNWARSCTKFFDITRSGAVGVYSPDSICPEVVGSGVEGMIVPQEQELWVDAILHLAGDERLRQSMLEKAKAKVAALSRQAERSYRALLEASKDRERRDG